MLLHACGRFGFTPSSHGPDIRVDGATDGPDGARDSANAADACSAVTLSVASKLNCIDSDDSSLPPASTAKAVGLPLPAGTHTLAAAGGVTSYSESAPCHWAWQLHAFALGWTAPLTLTGDVPQPPVCSDPDQWPTAAEAIAAAQGKTLQFATAAQTTLSLYVADTYCDDNSGSLSVVVLSCL